jgi:hypothetical protein
MGDARRATSAGAARGPRRAERLRDSAPAIRCCRCVFSRGHVLLVAREVEKEGEVWDQDRRLVALDRVAAEVALDSVRHAITQSHPLSQVNP